MKPLNKDWGGPWYPSPKTNNWKISPMGVVARLQNIAYYRGLVVGPQNAAKKKVKALWEKIAYDQRDGRWTSLVFRLRCTPINQTKEKRAGK